MLQVAPSYPLMNTANGPSPFWFDMPPNIDDRNIGYVDTWQPNTWGEYPSTSGGAYTSATSGGWNGFNTYGYQDASVVAADAGLQGGGATFNADGDNEGVYLMRNSAPFLISTTSSILCMEWIVQRSTIADTKHNLFFGLMETFTATTGVPISTADAMIDKNQIGFFLCGSATAGNGAIVRAVYKKAGQTAQMFTTGAVAAIDTTNITTAKMATMVAATTMKFGLKYYRNRDGLKAITIYIDGSAVAFATSTNVAAATFPTDKQMAMTFGIMNATGTTPGTSTCQWARCAQLWN